MMTHCQALDMIVWQIKGANLVATRFSVSPLFPVVCQVTVTTCHLNNATHNTAYNVWQQQLCKTVLEDVFDKGAASFLCIGWSALGCSLLSVQCIGSIKGRGSITYNASHIATSYYTCLVKKHPTWQQCCCNIT